MIDLSTGYAGLPIASLPLLRRHLESSGRADVRQVPQPPAGNAADVRAGWSPPLPAPTASAPFPAAVPAPTVKPGFYRSPLRTFLLAAVAGATYLIWWCFQLLAFAQRERFENSASPWWVVIPIGNLVHISRAFREIADGETARLGRTSLNIPLANAGLISMIVVGRLTANVYGIAGLALDVTIAVVTAGVLAMVQRSANAYQASLTRSSGPHRRGWRGAGPGATWSPSSWEPSSPSS